MSTAQSTTEAEYYVFGVGCMRLTQISHLLNELGIPTIPHVFYDSQSMIVSISNTIYRGIGVAYITAKYSLDADMARDAEINMNYLPTTEMLASCFTRPLPNPTFLKQCAAMGMIAIGLGNGQGNVVGIGPGIGHGNGIGNAIGKQIDWFGAFVSRRSTLLDWFLFFFVYCVCLKQMW